MGFKKVSQLIWMVLVFLFIAVLFLHVYSESIKIEKASGAPAYIKFNKLTGKVYFIRMTKSRPVYKWRSIEALSGELENND